MSAYDFSFKALRVLAKCVNCLTLAPLDPRKNGKEPTVTPSKARLRRPHNKAA
jgi:hypothetical protein